MQDLPPHSSLGLFRAGVKEDLVDNRYTKEPIWLQDNKAPVPRDCGITVFNVNECGDFQNQADENTNTQDFIFKDTPILVLKNLPTCLKIIRMQVEHFDNGDGLTKAIEKREDKDLLRHGTFPYLVFAG